MAAQSVDPAVLDRLEGLELVARTVVEGFMAGHHRSPLRGSSSEFAQHREYVPGDELRRLDWKVFARSDRLVIKEYFEETNLSCHFLLDASESMAFGSLDWTKFDYARWCTAALAHLVLASRDTAGLVVFDQKEKAKVPPKTGAEQERTIFDTLSRAKPEGPTGVGSVLQWLATRLKSRGIVAVFSDFFDDPETIVSGLRRLVHGGHEPILFQVLDPLESSFDLDRLVRFDGLEGSGQLKIDPKAIRTAYLEELAAHTALLKKHARSLSLDFVELSTKQPLDAALSTYLARRTARARGGRR
ncbi:MAG: DUF58 domain-containing protein [Planctomycetes bacterium]|nr:DUF58 domain-containing protein [Planctomycetota bacterium]